MVTDSQFHFSMAMPKGFKKHCHSGRELRREVQPGQGGLPRVQVDYTGSPTSSAKTAWVKQWQATKGSFDQYQHIGIDTVSYKGFPSVADWKFKETINGVRVRVVNRGIRVDSTHGYAILIRCEDSEWDAAECKTLRDTAFATFKPVD